MAGNGIRSAWADCAPGRRQRPRPLLSRARVFALLKRVALFILRRLSTELVLASGLAWIRQMLSLTTSMTNCPLVIPANCHQCVSPESSRSKSCSPVQTDGQRMRANRPFRSDDCVERAAGLPRSTDLGANVASNVRSQPRERELPTPSGTTSGAIRSPKAGIQWREAKLREEEPGLGSKAAKCCMNSRGIASCVVPSCQDAFSICTTCPAALHCTRSSASARRVMIFEVRYGGSSASRPARSRRQEPARVPSWRGARRRCPPAQTRCPRA